MKTKVVVLFALLGFVTISMMAQGVSKSYKKETIDHLEMLFEVGRKSYVEVGNKAQIKRIIDAYEAAISQSRKEGILTQRDEDSLLLYVKCYKLYGDYHYLNSDEDSRSFALAETCFKEALAFAEDTARACHKDIYYYQFILHEELAQLYYKQGRYQEAYNEMKAAEKQTTHLNNNNERLDFISQLALCKARIGKFMEAIDDINFVIGNYQGKKSEPYGEALRKKAKILMLQQESDDTGMADPTEEALKCYEEYYALKKEDALKRLGDMKAEDREQYWMRIRPFLVDCYRLEEADPAFLYDATLFSKALLLEYANKGKPHFYNWKQVQKAMKPNECAIEFVQYEKHNGKQMGALVLHKIGQPRFVGLGSVKRIKNYLLCDLGRVETAINEDCPDMKDALYSDTTLFQLIWTKPLLDAIGENAQKVYFAADGLFHQLAIEYMLPEQAPLRPSNLFRLSSTRQLLGNNTVSRGAKVLACGGINFDYASESAAYAPESGFSNDDEAYRHIQSMDLWWGELPGTKAEIDSIGTLFDSRQMAFLSDSLATETRFVKLAKEFPVVHVATHGYFGGITPEGTDLIPASYDESLSYNVLALAGINSSLHSDDFDATLHDGILSAREIAQMDLSNVDLVVLSACQTGLGYLTDDGIYGLQRGLKNAGVKSMIVSLWSVDDAATALLMQSFYSYLKEEDAHAAFMHAREDLIATSRESERLFDPVTLKGNNSSIDYNMPQYVNAFILIDVK